MELVDRVIGMVMKRLEELGLYDNMLIAFISDHGEMNGRRAIVDKGVYLYPDIVRVPMVFKLPGQACRGSTPSNRLLHCSISRRRILDFAGIAPEAKFDGISLLPAIANRPGRGRSHAAVLWGMACRS